MRKPTTVVTSRTAAPNSQAPSFTSLAQSIAHHDAAIDNLTVRMTGVEDGLKAVHLDMAAMRKEMSSGFDDIITRLADNRASQGPGWGPVLAGGSAAAGIVGIIAYGIMTLVNSNLAPPIAKIQTKIERAEHSLNITEREDREELNEFRRNRKAEVDARIGDISRDIERIKEKLQWAPRVQAQR